MNSSERQQKDFFISYTRQDLRWAEWIAWVLEESGYTVVIQAWDFQKGGNFVLDMQKATEANRTIAVLSTLYLEKPFPQAEWAAAFSQDPTSSNRKLLPVRVEDCHPSGLLASIVYVDIFGCKEPEAQQQILSAVKGERGKPDQKPLFPEQASERVVPEQAPFPGNASSSPASGSAPPLSSLQENDLTPEQIEEFRRDYLNRLRRDCLDRRGEADRYTDIDLRDGNLPRFDSVFVPLELFDSAPSESGRDSRYSGSGPSLRVEELSEQLTIWHHLAQVYTSSNYRDYQGLIILARGGLGKTTLLFHIVSDYERRATPSSRIPEFPVLLYLKECQEEFNAKTPDLPWLIVDHYINQLGGSNHQILANCTANLTDLLDKWLREGRVLVLIDEFDELEDTQRETVSKWIKQQMRRYLNNGPNSVFILTSRRMAYERLNIEGLYRLWLTGFELQHQNRFIEQWYREKEPAQAEALSRDLIEQISCRKRLQEMAEIPRLLNLIIQIHYTSPGNRLPTERVDLYQCFCGLQLKRSFQLFPNENQQLSQEKQEKLQELLEILALAIVQQRNPQEQQAIDTIQQERAIEVLTSQSTILQQGRIEPVRFLTEMVDSGWLRYLRNPARNPTKGKYGFIYPSFQGYLAERRIRSLQRNDFLLQDLKEDLLNPLKKDCRREIVLFYAAQATQQDLTFLLQELCNLAERADNSPQGTSAIAALAYDCLQETTQIWDGCLQNLRSLRYYALETYLRTGAWEQAERETYLRMIQVVGKEDGPWFSTEDLRTFPAEELRYIDDLWVEHSQDRFGFTVQRRIYLECGGPTDGSYDLEAWGRFGDRVGWRNQDGEWVNELIFDLSAPEGHLPLYPPALWAFMRRQGGALFSNSAWEDEEA